MDDRRWLVLVAAACVCGALYLGIEIGGYAASDVGGRITLTAAIPAVLVIAFLAVVAIRLSAEIARPSGVSSAPLTGVGRSRGVGVSIGIQVAFLVLVFPLLDVISKAVGLRGTTNVPLEHRSLGVVLLVSWSAILIAPWMEEISMRGFLLAGLGMRLGFWPAAAISSLVWAALHGVGGVLIPFVAEGIVLCWIRRRTGSVRTGIALHAAQNTVATLVTGAGLLAAPPLIVLVSSLVVTRADSRDSLTLASRTASAWVVEKAQALAGRLAGLPTPPVGAWVVAGLALGAGVSLVSVHAVFDAAGGGFETAGRLLTAAVAMPVLCWLLVTGVRVWGAPATTCLLGGSGCVVVIVLRAAQLGFASDALVELIVLGYALISFGLCGLAATTVGVRPRIAAAAAGICLVFTVTPVPYLTTSRAAILDQSLVAFLATALALVAVGITASQSDRPPASELPA